MKQFFNQLHSFFHMVWLWFSLLLMVSASVANADIPERQKLLSMDHVIVQSDAGCSGVVVGEQMVVTAKHCVGLKTFRWGKEVSNAHLLWQSSFRDGPAFYRVRSGFGRRSIAILPEAPPVRQQIGLYWAGQTRGTFGRHGGLEVFQDVRTKDTFEANLITTTAVPGSSGGAAVYDGKLAGVILLGNQEKREAGICTNEELRRGYTAAWKLLQANEICTVYVTPNCSACLKMERDDHEGRYVKIPVDFRYVDLSLTPIAGIDSSPTFEVLGKRFSPTTYDGKEVAKWIMSVLRERDESERNIVDLKPVPEPAMSPVNVSRVSSQPDEQMMPEEIDWKGVRIIGVVQKNYSAIQSLMAGPISRMVDNMSNDKVHFETVFEASEPLRYRSVCAATDLTHSDIPVYVFVMVDTIAEVGFVKGQVLAQIERHIDKALTDKMREIPIEVITRRINTDTYNGLAKALGTSEVKDRGDEPDPEYAVVDRDKPDDPEEATTASHAVATGFSFLSISTLFRVWRFWSSWHHSSTVEQSLALSASISPPVAHQVSQPAVKAASPAATVPPA